MEEIRRAHLQLSYDGTDISADLAPYLLSASYRDHAHGKADDLQLTLEDKQGLWRGVWFPSEGAKVKAKLVCRNWQPDQAEQILPLGAFTIDEIECGGPPATVTLKAISALVTTSLRREHKSKAWENISLQAIVTELATNHGLQHFWQADADVQFSRLDQSQESDLAFLTRICRENGFNCKVAEEKLIVYQAARFDQVPPVLTIQAGQGWVKSHGFKSKAGDVYKAVQVAYWDPEAKDEKRYTFTSPHPPASGHVLKVNQRAESLADAERKARAALRRKNKEKVTGRFTLVGRPDLQAGVNIAVAGYGVFDGTYFVEESAHAVGSGYQTSITIRKVLDY
jgi:phage protein D